MNKILELERAIMNIEQDIKNERNEELKNAMTGKKEAMQKLLEIMRKDIYKGSGVLGNEIN